MKRLVVLSALLVLILSACGENPTAVPTPTEAPLPVLQVDSQHMLTPGLAYEIPAGTGFVLDATGYVFGTASEPNSVQVVIDGRAYTTYWRSGESVQTIHASQLLPPSGLKPLTVFPAGRQMIIAIGMLPANGMFDALWVATIDVK